MAKNKAEAQAAEAVFASEVHVAGDINVERDEQIAQAIRVGYPPYAATPEAFGVEVESLGDHADGGELVAVRVIAASPADAPAE